MGDVRRRRERASTSNWDNREDRREIRAARWPGGAARVVPDELHKRPGWKGWLKGEFDKHRERLRLLVTGGARLDVVLRGGDSLQVRYYHGRLHPFSLAEISNGGSEPAAAELLGEPPPGLDDHQMPGTRRWVLAMYVA